MSPYSKYRNKPTCVDGHHFPSKLEAECYSYLKLLPEVTDIKCQQVFYLTKARITYKADFVVLYNGEPMVYEAKGIATERWRMIKKLWTEYGPCTLRVYYTKGRIEEIIPVREAS